MGQLKNIGLFLAKRLEQSRQDSAIGWVAEGNKVLSINFEDYFFLIEELAFGLEKIGIKKGVKVAILGQTCKEWHLFDIASLMNRACVVPIYPTYTDHEIEFIFNHSESEYLVVENDLFIERIAKIQRKLPKLKAVISFQNVSEEMLKKFTHPVEVYSLDQVKNLGKSEQTKGTLHKKIEFIDGMDLASIIYTSGTTGVPKGAMITQHAFASMLHNVELRFRGILNREKVLTFLPLSHVFGRADSMLPLALGTFNIYSRGIDFLTEDLALVKPSLMLAVPRVFEKIYQKIQDQIDKQGPVKKSLFEWAYLVSKNYFEKIETDRAPSSFEILQRKLAYNLVFSKIYARFGGNIRFFVSGGAPLSPEIQKFLRNANLIILEGYGLTETIAPCTLNPLHKQIPGTVGTPLGDVQVRFAEDGEILLKSEAIFSGYYKDETATREAFEDGLFKTGDIGKFTPEGHLQITDRKKDIIITSGGKNIAPQKIENLLKGQKHISHAMIIGDKRKYLTAILAIEKEVFIDELEAMGLDRDCGLAELSAHPHTRELLQKELDAVNQDLAQFETIKSFFVADREFTVDNALLTPSMKVRKKAVAELYKDQIEKLYSL